MDRFKRFRDFVNCFGTASWLVAAVKAPIDSVTGSLAAMLGREPVIDARVEPPTDSEATNNYITVIQPTDAQWTIVFFCLGDWHDYSEEIRALSRDLGTLVLDYSAEDTSAAEGMTLYESGVKQKEFLTDHDANYLYELMQEVYDCEEDGEQQYERWKSEKEKVVERVDDYGLVWERLGIAPITAYVKANGAVAIAEEDLARVKRVDLIEND